MLLVRLGLVFRQRPVGFGQFGDEVHLGRVVGGSGAYSILYLSDMLAA